MKPLVIKLRKQGAVLSTRERGRALADELEGALRDGIGVVLSFQGVKIVTPSYLDEVLTRAAGVLRRPGAGVFVATGVEDEVRETLELVLAHRKLMLAALTDEHVELLGGSRQLEETLRQAEELKEFTARDLAERLRLKLPNLHQRLKALEEAGALVKHEDETADRGRRYIWRTATAGDPPGHGSEPQRLTLANSH